MIKESIHAVVIGMIPMFMTANAAAETKYEKFTIASGAFWCMEPHFEKHDGAIDVIVGYACGNKPESDMQAGCIESYRPCLFI